VQIVEVTEDAVRAVELRLRRPGGALEFLLYPMIHIADPEFYADITRRLSLADVIVAEGVGESMTTFGLTSAYRMLADQEALGVVEQDIDYEAFGVPVIRPDFSGEQFDSRWRTISLWQRGVAWASVGSLIAAQRMFGPQLLRYQLDHAGMDDLPTLAEVLAPDAVENIMRVIVHERDQPLVKALVELHEQRADQAVTVAVVYGAAHVRAVLKGLRPLGYRVVSGDWLTVKNFD
jgi:hypothetical protein